MSYGLPSDLRNQLVSTLLRCGPFANQAELQVIFTDERISPWADEIPDAGSPRQRAESLISLLSQQQTADGHNALINLLHVLADRQDPATACHQDLHILTDQLQLTIDNRPLPIDHLLPAPKDPSPKSHTDIKQHVGEAQSGATVIGIQYNIHTTADQLSPPLLIPSAPLHPHPPSPYKGLHAFTITDVDRFFGRERYTQQLLEAVQSKPFVALLGPSGSGKSSLVQAGLLAQLQKQGDWLTATLRPGGQPYQTLAAALLPLLEAGMSERERLKEQRHLAADWQEAELTLADILQRILEKHSQTHFLLIVDQFEELYTLTSETSPPHRFLDLLLAATTSPNCHLLLTLRADFLGQALAYRPLADALQGNDLKLGPMTPEELRQAIVQPATDLNVTFEAGLVERILEDVIAQPGSLPLLQFALDLLWERPSNRQLTHMAYEEIGNISGALATYADQVYNALSPEEQDRAQYIFGQLVQPGQGMEDTRRVALRTELSKADWALIQQLATHRLIVTGRDETEQETAEVTHEALIQRWGQLQSWLNQDRAFRIWQEQLRVILRQWQMTQDDNDLLQGSLLAAAADWFETHHDQLSQAEHAFIEKSQAQQKREATIKRLRNITVGVVVIFIIISLIIATSIFQGQSLENSLLAQENENIAGTAVAQATQNFQLAEDNEETANQNAQLAEENENIAATAIAALNLVVIESDARATSVVQANEARDDAEMQAAISISQALAVNSEEVRGQDDMRALLLAIEAGRMATTTQAFTVLHNQLPLMAKPETNLAHESSIRGTQWNNNKALLLTYSFDGTAKVWNTSNWSLEQTFFHGESVGPAQWNSDESLLLTVGGGLIKLWQTDNGSLLHTLNHEESVRIAQWSSDERLLLTAGDESIKLWQTDNGSLQHTFNHEERVWKAEWNRDNTMVLSLGTQMVKVWSVADGSLLHNFAHQEEIRDAKWNRAGTLILTVSANLTNVWDANSGTLQNSFVHDDTQEAPWSNVEEAHWNKDESLIVSVGGQIVKIWDTDNGNLLYTLEHPPFIDHMEFNDENLLLISGNQDSTIWDMNNGELLHTLNHGSRINEGQWNANQSLILTVSQDGTAKVWDATTGTLLHTLIHDDGLSIRGASWNRNESRILTFDDRKTKIWDTSNGALLQILTHNNSSTPQWNEAGDQVLINDGSGVKVWDVADGALWNGLHNDGGILEASWNSDGSRILTTGNWIAQIWDATNESLLYTLAQGDVVRHAQWNHDKSLIMTIGHHSVQIWDTRTGELLQTLNEAGGGWNPKWNKDESRILTYGGKYVKLWDAMTGALLQEFLHEATVYGALWNEDESKILIRNGGFEEPAGSGVVLPNTGLITVWDAHTGSLLYTLEHDDGPAIGLWNEHEGLILTYTPDPEYVTEQGIAKVWDATDGTLLYTLTHEEHILEARWNEDGSRILTSGSDGMIKEWDAFNGNVIHSFAHNGWVKGAIWNSDESLILTSSWDGTAKLWNATNGSLVHMLIHNANGLASAQWNKNESFILTHGTDGTAKLWDASSGILINGFHHDDEVLEAQWNEDESKILTRSRDGTAKVWNAATGELLLQLLGDGEFITDVRWNESEDRILLITIDGFIQVYYTRLDQLMAVACERAIRNLTWAEWQLYLPTIPYRQTCPNLPPHPSVPEEELP
ncbi:MAG: AAA family ATPase [Ardenticatenaceae bacterium]|nr:AAA family ATPase [Ardenticatenaceae bacterium]